MSVKKVEPIEMVDGELVFNCFADEANSDWIRSARLPADSEELKNKFDTPMYYVEDGDE